jgi:hypothetical protein
MGTNARGYVCTGRLETRDIAAALSSGGHIMMMMVGKLFLNGV